MAGNPSFAQALLFLDDVRRICPENYVAFLETMKALKHREITKEEVVVRARELFAEKEELLEGFEMFLKPTGYDLMEFKGNFLSNEDGRDGFVRECYGNINGGSVFCGVEGSSTSNSRAVSVSFDDARNFVKMVKTTYQNEPHVYCRFLELLHNYHRQKISLKEIYRQMMILFHGYPLLIRGFSYFLPNAPASQNSRSFARFYERNSRRQQQQHYQKRKTIKLKERIIYGMMADSLISREEAEVYIRRIRLGGKYHSEGTAQKRSNRSKKRSINRNRHYSFV